MSGVAAGEWADFAGIRTDSLSLSWVLGIILLTFSPFFPESPLVGSVAVLCLHHLLVLLLILRLMVL